LIIRTIVTSKGLFVKLSFIVNVDQVRVFTNLLHVALKTVANLMNIFIFVVATRGRTQTKIGNAGAKEREIYR